MTPLASISAVEHGAAKVHCQLQLRADGHLWSDIADESREPEAALLDHLRQCPSFPAQWVESDAVLPGVTLGRIVCAWQRLRNLGLIEQCPMGWKAKAIAHG
jgi:hypothetical protein